MRVSSGQNGKNTHKGCLPLPFRPSLTRNGYRRITDSASVFLAIVFGTLARTKRFSYGIFCSLRSPFFYRFAPGLSLLAERSRERSATVRGFFFTISLLSRKVLIMGTMNTLRADYIGKVGKTYGVRQYGKSIEKAIPFSHSPHNATQTRSVRAFEKLNRFSAYVAKTFWRYLNLSDKTMYKHNAVAKWLKPCVKNHSFQLANLVEVIPPNSSLRFGNINIDLEAKTAEIEFINAPYSANTTREDIFIALVTDNGTVKAGGAFSSVSQTVSFSWDYSDFISLSVVMFKSSVQFGKKIINGLCLHTETQNFVIDGILYTSLMPLNEPPRYNEGILTFSDSDFSFADNILHWLEN